MRQILRIDNQLTSIRKGGATVMIDRLIKVETEISVYVIIL